MPYYEVNYSQKSGPIALDGLLDEHGVVITTQDSFTLMSEPATVGTGVVLDALGEFKDGVILLSDTAPPSLGSNLTTSKWIATVDRVELTTLGPATPLRASATPPQDAFEVSPWEGLDFGTAPVKIFNETWTDDNLLTWRNKTFAIPGEVYPRNILVTFESSPDTSYLLGSGLITRTADGTAYNGNYYMRMLRNSTTSTSPGVKIIYTFNNDSRYQVKIWARVPATSATTQVLYVRYDLTTFGNACFSEQTVTVPKDNVWREYTLNFTLSSALGVDDNASNGWWIQHLGSQADANGYLDIDSFSVTYLGRV